MIAVSVILMILLSTTLICDAVEDINCVVVRNSLTHGLDRKHVRITKNDFPSKPISGKDVNYCSSFDHTCCLKSLEEKLAAEASRNFKQDLDYVMTGQRLYCRDMKTELSSAIEDAFKEKFTTGIIQRIDSTNITGYARQLLSPLYNYLTQFTHSQDICSLSKVVEFQLLQLAKQVFHSQVGKSACFEATIKQHNVKYVRSIMEQLEPLLGKLRYLLKGYTYRNRIIEFMSTYRASPHCAKSLMVMTFCSTCTHGITPFVMTPCHNLCVNTMQGCLVDLADLNYYATQMVKLLDGMKFQLHLSSQINHVGIKLRRYILGLRNDSALIKEKLIANNCLPENYKRDLTSNTLFLTPNVEDYLPPLTTDSTDLTLTDAITNELKCIKHITLLNVPDKMCTERYDTKEENNHCWSASSATGYTAPVAEFSRQAIQQNLNPVFQDVTIPNMNILTINITRFVKEIREIDYQLHCSDDEDCMKFPYLSIAQCEYDNSTEEFSGSGDSNDNTGDDDDTTEPVSSGDTPIIRINIAVKPKLPDTNVTLPPVIVYTNSAPTTALPTTEPTDKSTAVNVTGDNTTSTNETYNDATNTKDNLSPVMGNHHSGISILHSKVWNCLLPMWLGILYIF